MTPEEHLLAAAEDMSAHGHAKGRLFGGGADWRNASSCALGSLARSNPEGHIGKVDSDFLKSVIEDCPATARLADHLRRSNFLIGLDFAGYDRRVPLHRMPDYEVITSFNDARNTTGEDVILSMKRAAGL